MAYIRQEVNACVNTRLEEVFIDQGRLVPIHHLLVVGVVLIDDELDRHITMGNLVSKKLQGRGHSHWDFDRFTSEVWEGDLRAEVDTRTHLGDDQPIVGCQGDIGVLRNRVEDSWISVCG